MHVREESITVTMLETFYIETFLQMQMKERSVAVAFSLFIKVWSIVSWTEWKYFHYSCNCNADWENHLQPHSMGKAPAVPEAVAVQPGWQINIH